MMKKLFELWSLAWFGSILVLGLAAIPGAFTEITDLIQKSGPDAWVDRLFVHESFTIFYGVILYYAILFSLARNKAKKAGERFSFKMWWHDQLDEFLVVALVGFALISFDDDVLVLINAQLPDGSTPLTMGNWVYLTAGPVTDMLTRLIIKLKS